MMKQYGLRAVAVVGVLGWFWIGYVWGYQAIQLRGAQSGVQSALAQMYNQLQTQGRVTLTVATATGQETVVLVPAKK